MSTTDIERDERLRQARKFADYCRSEGCHDDSVVALDDEVARLDAVVTAVRDLADRWEHGATRWENPLPVPDEVHQLRRALDRGAA